jgi:uncharacterized protein (TIGR00255 family)
MHSMTGYGSGRSVSDGAQCVVEIQSVNRKQSEIVINLPRELASLEPRVREAVNARVSRGRLAVSVVCKKNADAAAAPALDAALARSYYQAMLALQKEIGAGGEISIETILRAPGVLRLAEDEAPAPEQVWPQIESALGQSLDALMEMRAHEGGHLAADLRARLEGIGEQLALIRSRQPLAVANYRQSLIERLERAKLEAPVDEERLAKEIALFAERCDISEELIRLESHLDQFRALLKKDEPVGRPMDFLSQEMARELNTLGAKANDLPISQATLACKAELDKIREQVQNIE